METMVAYAVCTALLFGMLSALARVLLREQQYSLLELLVASIASTLPVGALLRGTSGEIDFSNYEQLWSLGILCVGSGIFVGIGSMIGLSWANRLGITKAWTRLILLALGWIYVPSLFVVVFAGIGTICMLLMRRGDIDLSWRTVGLCWATTPVLMFGSWIEWKARKANARLERALEPGTPLS